MPRNLHYLFLIDDDPISLRQDRLQRGMEIGDLSLAVFAGDIIGYLRHRARTVEGDHCHDVIEAVGAKVTQHLFHSRGFQLEQTIRLSPAQKCKGGAVIQWK